MNKEQLVFRSIPHGGSEYRQTVSLRDEILRQPLGLKFDPAELAAEGGLFHLGCWAEGKLVAGVVLQPDGEKRIRLRQFAVAQAHQGQGIGRALNGFAEAFAKDRGFREILLHARATAIGFYGRLGYQVEGETFQEVGLPHKTMRKHIG